MVSKYFVLKPKGNDAYALASRRAMRAYAECISEENPELSGELYTWARHEMCNVWDEQRGWDNVE